MGTLLASSTVSSGSFIIVVHLPKRLAMEAMTACSAQLYNVQMIVQNQSNKLLKQIKSKFGKWKAPVHAEKELNDDFEGVLLQKSTKM